MVKIVFSEDVLEYLQSLILILEKNNYFSNKTKAKEYVDDIYFFYEKNIPIAHSLGCGATKGLSGNLFRTYGSNCRALTYRKNKNTTWCAVYNTKNDQYLVLRIFNNHVGMFNELI